MTDLTCLITSQPIEGESIEVEFVCEDKYWGKLYNEVLKVLDQRLTTLNKRIIEDMNCAATLTASQYKQLMDVFYLQFPSESLDPPSHKIKDISIRLRKMTNNREQIAFGLNLKEVTFVELLNHLQGLLHKLDTRLVETNARDLDAYDLFSTYQPQDKMLLQMILDVLYGRARMDQVTARLAASHNTPEAQAQAQEAVKEIEISD